MPDDRIRAFTYWFDGEYKKKYGVGHVWNKGKEQKNIQRALAYLDGMNPTDEEKETHLQKLKDASVHYLSLEDDFVVEIKHDLNHLCTKLHKYMILADEAQTKEKAQEAMEERREEAQAARAKTIESYAHSAPSWPEQMAADPEGFMKTFATFQNAMKKSNPNAYQTLRRDIVDFYGKERAVAMFKEYQGQELEIGKELTQV